MTSAQITIFLDDSGVLHAEAPNSNNSGVRRKIELHSLGAQVVTIDNIASALRANALTLADELKAQYDNRCEAEAKAAEHQRALVRARKHRITTAAKLHVVEQKPMTTKLNTSNIDNLLDNGQLEIKMTNGNWWQLRRNGQTRRWKRNPDRIRVPVKAGLRIYDVIATYDYDIPGDGHLLSSPYIRVKGS